MILPALEAGSRRAGRAPSQVAISVNAFVATDDAQVEFVRIQIAFYASTPSYRPVMALRGWEEAARELSHLAASGRWEAMPRVVTDKMVHAFAVVAPVEHLAQALQARYAGVAHRPAAGPHHGGGLGVPGERSRVCASGHPGNRLYPGARHLPDRGLRPRPVWGGILGWAHRTGTRADRGVAGDPQATYATLIRHPDPAGGREGGGSQGPGRGSEGVAVPLPAVIPVPVGTNEPRLLAPVRMD